MIAGPRAATIGGMEILSLQFASALLAIVVIDLMLAGDNAIVIALAARRLPAHLQKRAILWGSGRGRGAQLMTLVVVWGCGRLRALFARRGAHLDRVRLLRPEDNPEKEKPGRR